MNKQPEITEATRAAFVTAFCQLSLAHPHEKITVQQISDRAGYNRTTFYRYFCDTIAVRDYLEDTLITGVITTLRGRAAAGLFDDDFFAPFLELCRTHRDELAVLLSDENRTHLSGKVQHAIQPLFCSLYGVEPNDIRTQYVINIYYSGVFAALGEWMKRPDAITEEHLLDIVRELFTTWFIPELEWRRTQGKP